MDVYVGGISAPFIFVLVLEGALRLYLFIIVDP